METSVRITLASASVVGLGMLLGASGYESVVMAPNFAARVPESLEHIRAFFVVANPGTFFRIVAPATQVLLLVSVAVCWRRQGARWWLLGSLVILVLADVITFTFHYPRNELLFNIPLDQVATAQLDAAARQWGSGNHVRVGLLAGAVIGALRGLVALVRNA
jgi:uncharacterized membrane protein